MLQQKTRYQVWALLQKNLILQSRQRVTNIIQVLTPVLGLAVIVFLREALISQTAVFLNESISLPIPFFYNIPLKPFRSFGAFTFFNVTECNEWYLYQFNQSTTTEADRSYFGSNDGLPMRNPESYGMLKGGLNVLEMPCGEVNRSVPFFVELKEEKDIDTKAERERHGDAKEVLSSGRNRTSLNQYMFEELLDLGQEDFNLNAKQSSLAALYRVPDGMIEVQGASDKGFTYRLQIMDYKYFQYHRNNGITKVGIVNPDQVKQNKTAEDLAVLDDTGNTTYIMRPTEGAMQLADRVNQAYIRSIFPEVHIVAGQQFMPFKPAVRNEAEKILNAVGNIVYPVLLALGLPVFLYGIVLEKETRLMQNMKINGLKMSNYWLVAYCFNFFLYMIVCLCYVGFGKYVTGLSFFTDTDPIIMTLLFVGWGLCQVSQAFFVSVFLNDSQTASMIGYSCSIIFTVVASTVMISGTGCGANGDYNLKN